MPDKTTEQIVKDISAAMRKAGRAGAVDEMEVEPEAAAAGKAKEEPKAKTTVLTSGDKVITRPNGDPYHVRKIGEHDDVAVLRRARERKIQVLMYGGPGCGKTALFEAAFASDGYEYLSGSGDTEVADFVGSWVPMPDGSYSWVDGPLLRAAEEGKPFLIDEVALVDPKVLSVVYPLTDGRGELKVTTNPNRGTVTAKPGFVIFGACNPDAPGARMSEALLSRYQLHLEVGPDFKLMLKMGVPKKIVTAAENMYTKVKNNGGMSWYPAIRELLSYKRLAEQFGETVALRNIVSQAPDIDRDQVASVLSQAWGEPIQALTLK